MPDLKKHVQYCSVTDVVSYLWSNDQGKHIFMAKVDITDAYRMVPIDKSDWRHLGMAVGNLIYIDRCLPMGASSSCQIFQRISDAIAWVTTSNFSNCKIFNYLDDFLILGPTEFLCKKYLDHFLLSCSQLGIPVSPLKTILPTQSLTFLGIVINASQKTLSIPTEKLDSTRQMLEKFTSRKRPCLGVWQKLLGRLNHVSQIVTSGRTYLGSVYGALKGVLSNKKQVRRRVSSEIKKDLLVWKNFLSLPINKPFKMLRATDNPDFSFATDACTTIGFGCVFRSKWFGGIWPNDSWKSSNIAVLELYPIYIALHLWDQLFSEKIIHVHTDNQALIPIINKLYSKDTAIRKILRPIADLCMSKNILVIAKHISGVNNVIPDLISRDKIVELGHRYPHINKHPEIIPENLLPKSFEL